MNIYEIDQQIQNLIMEDGEIADFEAFEALQMERDKKLENTALFIKNLRAEAMAIKAEENALKERRQAAENKQAWLERYLSTALAGQQFKTPKVSCSFRGSVNTVIDVSDEIFAEWAKTVGREDLLIYAPPKVSKTAVKAALEAGVMDIPAHIEQKANLQVG